MSRICFVSFEIHPTTWGGCGVLLYNAAHVLLSAGHEVVFLLDLPYEYFERFESRDRLSWPGADRCRAYHVDTLCSTLQLKENDFVSEFAWKAYRFNYACSQVYDIEEPDLIEFFDYCGVSYYALTIKVAGLGYKNSHLAVRLHNSIELMDTYEPTKTHTFDRYSLYALEHGALRLAETSLYPSLSYFQHAYRPHYEPWFGQKICSQSPLVAKPKRSHASPDANGVLFYGRLFTFKGVDIFVDAAVAYLNNSSNPRVQFHLVGYDSHQPPTGSGSYEDYLWHKIPPRHRAQFLFRGFLSWSQLEELLPHVKFGVVPSYYESFSYAAHELYAAGVPLIVSDIAGFRDFFQHDINALVFDGTVGDLTRQMERLSSDTNLRQRLSFPFPVADQALGDFYWGPFSSSWINLSTIASRPSLLVCLIDNELGDAEKTFAAVDAAGLTHCQIIRMRIAASTDKGITTWLLGALYTLHDRFGQPLAPTDVRTAEVLIILQSGDVPHPDYLIRSLGILGRQPQIAFVSSWKHMIKDGQLELNSFPLDILLELVPLYRMPTLSRCLMRTSPGHLLIDLFDRRAGVYGELAYLWDLDTERQCGLTIPEPLIEQAVEEIHPVEPRLLAYLLMRDQFAWRKARLSRYLLTVWNSANQQQIDVSALLQRNAQLEGQLAEINQSRAWNLIQTYRTRRHRSRLLQVVDRYVRRPLWRWLGNRRTSR